MMDIETTRNAVYGGCVFTIRSIGRSYMFRTYIYRRKVYIKYIRSGIANETHLGYLDPDAGYVFNKKHSYSRARHIQIIKEFAMDLARGRNTPILTSLEIFESDNMNEVVDDMIERQDEHNYLERIGAI